MQLIKSSVTLASLALAAAFGIYAITPAQTVTSVGPVSAPLTAFGVNQFILGFSQGAQWGPGAIDSTAFLAGPGPWGIMNSGPGGLTAKISVQNTGERTAEFYQSGTGGIFQSIAGGQSATFPMTLPANDALVVRFVGSGTEGKVIWVGR